MKQTSVLWLVSVLLLSPSFLGSAMQQVNVGIRGEFSPQDIELRDDAFHGRGLRPYTEWWYFDAMLNNTYSVQMSVRTLGVYGKGLVFVRLDLYKNGTLINHNTLSYHLKEAFLSSMKPFVQVQGKTILLGSYDNTTKSYVYEVSFDFLGSAAHLFFKGCTKGWKGQHQSGDWWAVILPRADVSGTITIDNTTIQVNGSGYHDHNWDVSTQVFFHFGWFWGRFNSEEYTAVWSAILTTRVTPQPILVINIKNEGYITIPSETIWFSVKNIHLNHLKFVPFYFTVETVTSRVFLVVHLEVVHVEHERVMGWMNYWRYHVKCTGIFMVDGHSETVDDVFIAEYIRFH
jgi:hypothetical protein